MLSRCGCRRFLLPTKTYTVNYLFATFSQLENRLVAASLQLRNMQQHLTVAAALNTRNSFYLGLQCRYASDWSQRTTENYWNRYMPSTQRFNAETKLNSKFRNTAQRSLSRYSASTIMSPHCKQFCFNDYDIIGFDLDCTVLRYNINEMIPLVYNILRRFLVEKKSYPRALLDQKLDKGFMQKGLVLDAEHGNILKLSADATILRAAHGTRALTQDQIVEIYGENRKWYISSLFFEDPLSTWNGPFSEKMRTLLDYFDFGASLVFAHAVDVLDAEALAANCPVPATYTIWPDILDGLMEIYTRENFANGKSAYFNALQSQPERFLLKTNPKVIKWIRELRVAGKSLFLLTGSNIDFANFTASYALGADWQELFDCVVCFARKPGYFVHNRPYLQIEALEEVPNSEISLSSNIKINRMYSQGNWEQLRRALSLKAGKPPEETRSLYLGDNLIQDIYTPVKHRDLDTVALCEELLAENYCDYEYADIISSPFWGSYFSIENKPTLWAEIISNYSQLCIPLIDSVAEKPITHKFFCENEQGFYPNAPAALAL